MLKIITEFFSNIFYSTLIKDWKDCKFEIKLIAIAIYTDEKSKKQEFGEAIDILKENHNKEFSSAEYDVLEKKIRNKVKEYSENFKLFIKDKDDVINYIIENNDVKKATIVKRIFLSDYEVSHKEKVILNKLEEIIEREKEQNND